MCLFWSPGLLPGKEHITISILFGMARASFDVLLWLAWISPGPFRCGTTIFRCGRFSPISTVAGKTHIHTTPLAFRASSFTITAFINIFDLLYPQCPDKTYVPIKKTVFRAQIPVAFINIFVLYPTGPEDFINKLTRHSSISSGYPPQGYPLPSPSAQIQAYTTRRYNLKPPNNML